MSASSLTPASRATRAASSAVECSVSCARSASSSQNVASWTSRSAPSAASTTTSDGAVSPVSTSLRPGTSGAEHLVGRHDPSVGERHGHAVLERSPLGAEGNSERVGRGDVEASGALLLDERVAERVAAVTDREGAHLVAVVRQRRSRRELDDGDLVGQPADDPPQRVEQVVQPPRAVRASAAARARAARTSSASRGARESDRRGSGSGRPRAGRRARRRSAAAGAASPRRSRTAGARRRGARASPRARGAPSASSRPCRERRRRDPRAPV